MSEAPNSLPPAYDGHPYGSPWFAPSESEQKRRRALLLRLRILLLLGLAGFTAVMWAFTRSEGSSAWFTLDPGPSVTVRRHLEALNRGDLKNAYGLFSEHYRKDVTFEMYHELIASHWQMFRTREVSYEGRETSAARAVLETRMLSADGEHYIARFTLVRAAGRWWIDDLRWAAAPDTSNRIRI